MSVAITEKIREEKRMDKANFNMLVDYQLARCKEVLKVKAGEYVRTDEDVLEHFKKAAVLQGESPRRALFGMLTKHLVSISDMCSGENLPDLNLWDEKIGDAINYLVLLAGVVRDEAAINCDMAELPRIGL